MKTIAKTLLVLLTFTTLFSCNKDEPTSNPEGFYMTAKIDTNDFTAIPDTVLVDYYTDNGDFMTITGKTADNKQILMIVNLQNYTQGSGTYTNNEVTFSYRIFDPTTTLDLAHWSTNTPGAGNGSLTITAEDDTRLKGTFSFSPFLSFDETGQQITSILITNGKFNAKK